MRKFFYISGLPRSGSTLLCNLLLQNPKIHATTTSSLPDLLIQLRDNWDSFEGHKTNPEGQNKWDVINSVLLSYHNTDKTIIFDKNRGWTNHIEFLEKITKEEVKMICCVRNFEDILTSFEKLFRKNRADGEIHSEFKNTKMKTVNGRCEVWMSDEGVIGRPYLNLKDAFDRGLGNRIKLLPFEYFTTNPKESMKAIYEFINEPFYDHDYKNIKQIVYENDLPYGWGNDLHKIKEGSIVPSKSNAIEIIGKELTDLYKDKEFWKFF